MANVSAPQGFRPLRRIDGAMWSTSVTPYRIASGYATSIYTGDVVKQVGGKINLAAAGEQMRGVFLGCKYIDSTGVAKISPVWVASTVTLGTKDAEAIIIDDPNVVFAVQGTATTAAVTQFGQSANLLAGVSPSATTGQSTENLDLSSLSTSTNQQFRILKFLDRPDVDQAATLCWYEVVPMKHDLRTLAAQA